MEFDVAVAGLGAMGSASASELARAKHRVVAFDRFRPPHRLGSSHGETRIIREAYWEHPSYVPLVQRAYTLWARLERDSKRRLLLRTGGLFAGPPGGEVVAGCRRAARLHRLPHKELDAEAAMRACPPFRLDEAWHALLEPRAGALRVEPAIRAFLQMARRHGARLRPADPVLAWKANEQGVRIRSRSGTHEAERLVLAVGPWVSKTAGGLDERFEVERVTTHWFRPRRRASDFRAPRFPVFGLEFEAGRLLYGLPDVGSGVKAALHHDGTATDPDRVDRRVRRADVAPVQTLVSRFLPGLDPKPVKSSVCLYTNSPDRHFRVDVHPRHDNVLVVSACSGHGFKFAPAIGEVVKDWVERGRLRADVRRFRWTPSRL